MKSTRTGKTRSDGRPAGTNMDREQQEVDEAHREAQADYASRTDLVNLSSLEDDRIADFVALGESRGKMTPLTFRRVLITLKEVPNLRAEADRLKDALRRIAIDKDVSCLAGDPELWPSTIACRALGLDPTEETSDE